MLLSCFLTYQCQLDMYVQGERIYEAQCSNCHMSDGSGLVEVINDISDSKLFNSQDPTPLIKLLINGGSDDREDGLQMPSYKYVLNRVEICNLINYLNHKWNKDFVELKIEEFDKIYKEEVDITDIRLPQ